MAGTISIQSSLATTQSGYKQIGPLAISCPNSIGEILNVAFTGATSQTIAPPVGAQAVVIDPPSSNLVGLTLKGVTGDTGIPISPNQPSVISLGSLAAGSFVLASAAAISGTVELSFL